MLGSTERVSAIQFSYPYTVTVFLRSSGLVISEPMSASEFASSHHIFENLILSDKPACDHISGRIWLQEAKATSSARPYSAASNYLCLNLFLGAGKDLQSLNFRAKFSRFLDYELIKDTDGSKIKIKMKTLKMSSQMPVTSGMIIILLYFSLSEHLEGWQLLLAGNNLLKSGCSVALELCCSSKLNFYSCGTGRSRGRGGDTCANC